MKRQQHRMTKSREYQAWGAMVNRCTNSNNISFHHYGGRGIGICPHWRNSFEAFFSDLGPRPQGQRPREYSLERIDNSKGYLCPLCCPPIGNCRWATQPEQVRNSRRNVRLKAFGREQVMEDWAREIGVKWATLWYALKHKTLEQYIEWRKSRTAVQS